MDCPFGIYDLNISFYGSRLMLTSLCKCNGFSAGINPDDFRGPGFQNGFDPLWTDMFNAHQEKPYHCMVGGGDQIYCDAYGAFASLDMLIL